MDKNSILQRTEIGRKTVMTKAVRLTQSERLVLIIVDGISPVHELRKKVWAIPEERFLRALKTLVEKGLIFEVLMPVPGQEKETLDQEVMDRFLQQDPLDPVTIISLDPEDEFGNDMAQALGFKSTLTGTPAPAPKAAAGPGTMEARALPKSNPPAPRAADASRPQAAARPMLDSRLPHQATARPDIQKKEHMPSAATVGAAATARTKAAPVSVQPKNSNGERFPPQRKDSGIRQKALRPDDNLPDNWPENLFEKESRAAARRTRSRKPGLHAGTAILSLGACVGVFGLAFIATRSLLHGGWSPFH